MPPFPPQKIPPAPSYSIKKWRSSLSAKRRKVATTVSDAQWNWCSHCSFICDNFGGQLNPGMLFNFFTRWAQDGIQRRRMYLQQPIKSYLFFNCQLAPNKKLKKELKWTEIMRMIDLSSFFVTSLEPQTFSINYVHILNAHLKAKLLWIFITDLSRNEASG